MSQSTLHPTIEPQPAQRTSRHGLRLEEKHPAALRWMHWINFPLLFLMILSGIMIYWGDSIPPGLSMHRVYRIGFGHFTLIRLFPDSFYRFGFAHKFHQGLGFHAFGMWLFIANGLAYMFFLAISGQWRHILPDRRAFAQLLPTLRAEFNGRHAAHSGKKYNPAQRLAYTAVILMGVGSVVTGIAIWKPTSLHWIATLCGGYETARWLHFWLTLAFCGFFLVHVGQVLRAGWNNLRSMIVGAEVVSVPVPELPAIPLGDLAHE